VQEQLRRRHDIPCGFVSGETPTAERDATLKAFRDGDLRFLCNVNVLTTGFDAPGIDCVAMLRPTMSAGLYYQMVGRGFRLNPGKANCLVLDFGGNVLRHGPVDAIRIQERSGGQGEAPAKECPSCHVVIAAGYAICPQCGFEFPPPERQKHEAKASEAGILSGQVTDTEFNVQDISYSVHTKRGAPPDAPRTMRVTYRLGLTYSVSEFICFEHTGYARQKAETWWQARSDEPVPDTAEAAVEIATQIGIASSEAVTVRNVTGEQFERIVAHRLGERLAPIGLSLSDDDIPF
jgi:DNA repair protein RadD